MAVPDRGPPRDGHPSRDTFAKGRTRAPLQPIAVPTDVGDDRLPSSRSCLITGRGLYQFNAGTMTMRTPNSELHPTDLLEISVEDARRLGVADGAALRVTSRYGEAVLPAAVTARVRPGELFATFSDPRHVPQPAHRSPARSANAHSSVQGDGRTSGAGRARVKRRSRRA